MRDDILDEVRAVPLLAMGTLDLVGLDTIPCSHKATGKPQGGQCPAVPDNFSHIAVTECFLVELWVSPGSG